MQQKKQILFPAWHQKLNKKRCNNAFDFLDYFRDKDASYRPKFYKRRAESSGCWFTGQFDER